MHQQHLFFTEMWTIADLGDAGVLPFRGVSPSKEPLGERVCKKNAQSVFWWQQQQLRGDTSHSSGALRQRRSTRACTGE